MQRLSPRLAALRLPGLRFAKVPGGTGFGLAECWKLGRHVVLALAFVLLSATGARAQSGPTGWLDVANPGGGAGWAYDPALGSGAVTVHIYVDGNFATAVTANQPRPDLVAANAAPDPDHGFSFSLSGLSGGNHTVHAYAIAQSGNNPELNGSGKKINVPTSAPWGWLDYANGGGAGGWAYDAALGAAPVTVHIYVDGAFYTAVAANQPRPDLVAAGVSADPNHGFSSGLPQLSPGPHTIDAYAIAQGGSNPELQGSGKVATGPGTPGARCGAVEFLSAAGELTGYAFDPAQGGVTVEVWADGARNQGRFVGSVWANGGQPSSLGSQTGFEWVAPISLRDGRAHTLYVYSTDALGQNPLELSGSRVFVLRTGNPNLGDLTIQGQQIQLQTTAQFGGSCTGLTWNGLQFVNHDDHGREIQAAWTFGTGERLNPTEAGAAQDGGGPTRSVVLSATTLGASLTTTSHPAFWNIPGKAQALNGSEVTADLLTKTVTLDVGGDPHLIRWVNSVTLFADAPFFQLEAPTPYVNGVFTAFYTFDVTTGTLAPLDHTPADKTGSFPAGAAVGEDPLPVILATANGDHAIGVYSATPTIDYGRWDFDAFGNTSKSDIVLRMNNVPAGLPVTVTSYIAVGTLADVQASLVNAYQNQP